MENEKITYQFADTGHWLARCNHNTKVVELNAHEYASLSPMMRDYIWVHECVHLIAGVRSEADCNRLSDEIFISRARSKRELAERSDFVAAANDQSFTRVARPTTGNAPLLLALVAVIFLITKT
jgi:hypothetical protein